MADTTEAQRAVRDDAPEHGEANGNGGSRGSAAAFFGTAVGAMLLSGIGGAMKALHDRQAVAPPAEEQDAEPEASEDGGTDDGEPAEPEAHEPHESAARAPDEPQAREREADDDADTDEPMPPPEDGHRPEPEPEPARAEPRNDVPRRGVSGDEAAAVVTEARRQLASLLGSQPERVSGLERVDGG